MKSQPYAQMLFSQQMLHQTLMMPYVTASFQNKY